MIKSSLLALLLPLVFLQTSQAQDDFRISIVRGGGLDDYSFRAGDFDPPLDQSTAASLDAFPIIYYPADPNKKSGSSNAFYVVIENTQAKESRITMPATGGWHYALGFKFVDGTTKKSYSIAPLGRIWSADVLRTLSFSAQGMRILQVDLTDTTEWSGFPPASKHPIIGQLTATFRYPSDGKQVEVRSKPATVIFMAK